MLNYKDVFHAVMYRKQVELVDVYKLRPESYFSVLPSGDVLSDSDLDVYLCDQLFEQEFELTVVDQSSAFQSMIHSKDGQDIFDFKNNYLTSGQSISNNYHQFVMKKSNHQQIDESS